MNESLQLLAPAKVNLWLRVLAREASGYHSLETAFAAVSLADRLEFVRREKPGVELVVSGDEDTGPIGSNLVYRAATAFLARMGGAAGVRINLEKVIPAAGGLGGGSSDAAATLRGLSALFSDPIPKEDLLRIAAGLGSDVPFFLAPSPLALGWSRGERLLSLPPLPVRPVLIAHPGVAVPTGEAFRRLAEMRGEGSGAGPQALDLSVLRSWASIAELATNDFEFPAFEQIPRLAAAKERLLAAGAEVALLAGSGASVFGIFADASGMEGVVAELEREGWRCWRARTLEHWPQPTARH